MKVRVRGDSLDALGSQQQPDLMSGNIAFSSNFTIKRVPKTRYVALCAWKKIEEMVISVNDQE